MKSIVFILFLFLSLGAFAQNSCSELDQLLLTRDRLIQSELFEITNNKEELIQGSKELGVIANSSLITGGIATTQNHLMLLKRKWYTEEMLQLESKWHKSINEAIEAFDRSSAAEDFYKGKGYSEEKINKIMKPLRDKFVEAGKAAEIQRLKFNNAYQKNTFQYLKMNKGSINATTKIASRRFSQLFLQNPRGRTGLILLAAAGVAITGKAIIDNKNEKISTDQSLKNNPLSLLLIEYTSQKREACKLIRDDLEFKNEVISLNSKLKSALTEAKSEQNISSIENSSYRGNVKLNPIEQKYNIDVINRANRN